MNGLTCWGYCGIPILYFHDKKGETTMINPGTYKHSKMGRPLKYDPDVRLVEIFIPNFQLDLDRRMNEHCKERKITKLDMVHNIIKKEFSSKKAVTHRPLDGDPAKIIKRSFRRLPDYFWLEFQVKHLYYGSYATPTQLLMMLIQEEIIISEGKSHLLKGYHEPIDISYMGPLNFSPRIPVKIYQALHIIANYMGQSVNEYINFIINDMDGKQIKALKPFPVQKKEQYNEPRLKQVDREKWILFRTHCLRNSTPTHKMLASYLLKEICVLLDNKTVSGVENEVLEIIAPYEKLIPLL